MHEIMEANKFKKGDPRSKKAASNGGKKSVEIRRFKRDVQKLLDAAPLKNKTFDQLKEMFGDTKETLGEKEKITTRLCIIASMIERAGKGDVQAATFLRDTAGEKPKEEIEHSGGVVFVSGEDDIAD